MKPSLHTRNIIKTAEKLSWKQKEALNILSMEYMRRFSIGDRPRPSMLLKRIRGLVTTDKITSEFIERKQTNLLRNEIDNHIKKYGNRLKNEN